MGAALGFFFNKMTQYPKSIPVFNTWRADNSMTCAQFLDYLQENLKEHLGCMVSDG